MCSIQVPISDGWKKDKLDHKEKIPFDMKDVQNTQGKYESVDVWMELKYR